jgi:uncharacterized protein (DUF924 family)
MTPDTLKPILDEVHLFWFGELTAPTDRHEEKAAIWFKQSDETDRAIADRFGSYLQPAAEAEWDLAALTRQEAVALVVLLDQFPRNIFRNSGEAFAFDPIARGIAGRLVEGGVDRFYWVERSFLFLPFEHSEDVADQDYCLFLYARNALAAPESFRESTRGGIDFATKHRDIIRKFGRFPHRNAALGRASTEEELAFMAEKGRGY